MKIHIVGACSLKAQMIKNIKNNDKKMTTIRIVNAGSLRSKMLNKTITIRTVKIGAKTQVNDQKKITTKNI